MILFGALLIGSCYPSRAEMTQAPAPEADRQTYDPPARTSARGPTLSIRAIAGLPSIAVALLYSL